MLGSRLEELGSWLMGQVMSWNHEVLSSIPTKASRGGVYLDPSVQG